MDLRGMVCVLVCVLLVFGTADTGHGMCRVLDWRGALSQDERELYDEVVLAASGLIRRVRVRGAVSVCRVLAVLEAVRYDNPGLFWLGYSVTAFYAVPERVLALELDFLWETEEIPDIRREFDGAAEYALSLAREIDCETMKIRFVHDFLIDTNVFCEEAEFCQSAYSAAVLGRTVCMGFSMAFLYFMQGLDIPAALVTGRLGHEKHALNLVRVSGAYFFVDVTLNSRMEELGNCRYTFFMTDAPHEDFIPLIP